MAQSTTSQTHPQHPLEDPFDTLLALEDTLYTSAYTLGTRDGAHAGRIEGRIFGLEKGFEKFAALGALHGRAVVWGSQLPVSKSKSSSSTCESNVGPSDSKIVGVSVDNSNANADEVEEEQEIGTRSALPKLKQSTRLTTHITTLHALTDPQTHSTLNTEDAVADFDDRFKRAGAKAKMIERIASASSTTTTSTATTPSSDTTLSPKKSSHAPRLKGDAEGKKKANGDDNMEDFTGSRFLN